MTTLEHALVGADIVLASGLHRRFGWQLAAVAGICAVLPDWDGLTILWSVPLFDVAHRSWGHGILPCLIIAAMFAMFDYRFDFMTQITRRLVHWLKIAVPSEQLQNCTKLTFLRTTVWLIIATIASLSHLLADIVVSGTATLSDWGVKLFWPFSDRTFVYPLVPWGDVGNMVILLLGMFAMIRWKNRIQPTAILTLIAVVGYTLIRGML